LALIGELNASGPSNVVQLARRTGLNRTTCYRLLETLRADGYVTFDETNALFGLTPQVRKLSEGVSSRDLSSQAALPRCSACSTGVLAQRLRGVRTRVGADPREHPPFQPLVDSSLDGGPQAVAAAQRIGARHPRGIAAFVAPEMLETTASFVEEDAPWQGPPIHRRHRRADQERRLCLLGRWSGSGHQRHRPADSGRRPRGRQSQPDFLFLLDDTEVAAASICLI